METRIKFTASIYVATKFLLQVMRGVHSPSCPQPCWRTEFFSEVVASPIRQEPRQRDVFSWTGLVREVSFYKGGHLFATVTVEGVWHEGDRHEIDRGDCWTITKIRYALGRGLQEPENWTERVVSTAFYGGVL